MSLVFDQPRHQQKDGSRSRSLHDQRGSSPARRNLIVDAAIDLIDAGGFDALKMSTLARQFGISRALLYTVFAGRDALKQAASLRLEQPFVADLQRISANFSGLQQIQRAFRAHSIWW